MMVSSETLSAPEVVSDVDGIGSKALPDNAIHAVHLLRQQSELPLGVPVTTDVTESR